MDACRVKRNRARAERRRRAKKRLMAAEAEKTTKMQTRGGKKKWRAAAKRRYNKDMQKKKQRQRRHVEKNRQIWERLQAIVAKAKSTETTLLQLTKAASGARPHQPGQEWIDKAMAGRHWVAIGATSEDTAKANVGRQIKDGILLKVTVSIEGRPVVALIDSGASQSYITPETVAICELKCVPSVLHLELADGTKIQSTEQTEDTLCTLGECIERATFTVTKLLTDVDVVLGMDWLVKWNPVIDWQKQKIYVYVNDHWTQINGMLLDEEHHVGTVKVFDPYTVSDKSGKDLPDWTVVKQPKVWAMQKKGTVQKNEKITKKLSNSNEGSKKQTIAEDVNAKMNESGKVKKSQNECKGSCTLLTAKRFNKLLRAGEEAYLAVFLPSSIHKSGSTTKTKLQQMKEKGPVRKAPPIAETRARMCKEAPGLVRTKLQDLLKEYEDLFPAQLPKGRPPKRTVEFEINTEEGATPPNKPPYRLSPKEHEELQEQIDELLAQGHIRPSTSPYGAPVLFVPKKDGRWRMCVDYRALNRQTVRDRYPLPRIDDLLDRLGKARHFTTLDLASGYHQIAVRDQDIPKTAFRTQRGQFEFVVMPFGVTNAPSTFQRLMNSLFKEDLDKFVLVYLDDILVFSTTLEEHIEHIRKTLDRLREAKLYARLHKCAFFQTRVEYLGYDVSTEGIQPSPSKVKAVVEWPRPQSVRDVRGFLGLASFYRRFIKQFSLKAKPLTDLTREKNQWQWNEREEQAFNTLKKSLVVAPVLHAPDFDLPFVVTTDASLVSVGAILEQDFGQGLQPIAYESRKLNPAETRYSAYERELLGIVWAIGKWRHYLEGKHFTVQTDHSSLRHLPNQPSVNRRIWKWVSILQGYDMDIRHIPGKVNPADTLTRQVHGSDEQYAGEVRKADADWMQNVRVTEDATDSQIQKKLQQLYTSADSDSIQSKTQDSIQLTMLNSIQAQEEQKILAITESTVQIDTETKVQWMQKLMNEDPYAAIIQQMMEDPQCRQIERQGKKYRMKRGSLCLHEETQNDDQMYWRVIVPDDQEVKTKLLQEIHCVPYAGHPGLPGRWR